MHGGWDYCEGGTPTYKPQILHSYARLLSMLEAPMTQQRLWRARGIHRWHGENGEIGVCSGWSTYHVLVRKP